ncbi:AEC family transporter [Collinsella intestinalis]|uniref:AEC family transporter n=1 Tax=Collinsella intestinalis TaxID=147207 RepID=UPI001959D044|nr:AEC family transporter [Collinsella intestinalis]MBM6943089.1 AEC family transporter [Collinsella intestinalis]
MTEIASTLGSMLSLIIVTLMGYIAAKVGFLTADIRPKISGLIFNITLPCTILASVGEVDSATGTDAITWSLVLGAALFFVMLTAGALANLVLRTPRGERALYLWMSVLTNTGFIGFAVLESIFGGASVFLGSIFIAISNVFIYSIGVEALRSGSTHAESSAHGGARRRRAVDVRGMLKDMLNVPLVVSLVAMVIFFAGIPVPAPLMRAADMAGGITSPLAMMLVGLSIADAHLGAVLRQGRLWVFTLVRFLLAPLAAYLLLAPVVPSELALGVFTVMLAMPTGSMAAPIAATYGRDAELPAQGTIVATLASFAIVPVLMVVMRM